MEFKICITEMWTPVQNTGLALRSGDDPYHLFEPRTVHERSFSDRSFSYVAPRLYNRIPLEVKQLTLLESFKNHLKTSFYVCL